MSLRILMTGGTGFIGKHLIKQLHSRGHQISLIIRPAPDRPTASIPQDIRIISSDIHNEASYHQIPEEPLDSMVHMEQLLAGDIKFLRMMAERRIPKIFVSGTCFEYGMQEGCMSEETPAAPVLPYAMAKDFLRKYLQELQKRHNFQLLWGRLFYTHGPGQNSRSLLALLDKSIKNGDEYFNMSGGEQLRDYLPVEIMTKKITTVIESNAFNGIINICRGKPVSVRYLVEEHIKKAHSTIKLKLGHYQYPPHEPMAYWGSDKLVNDLVREKS